MKLSIIIPTYNSAIVIKRALESIISQTFRDWEVLVMDGVSKDNTLEIARSYNDERINVYSEPDNGIYDAMNKGIKKANGEFLYFLGSDDYLLKNDVLEQMLVDSDGLDMIYGDVEAVHLSAEHYGEWSFDTLLYNRCHQAIFYRSTAFKKVGLYPLCYPICADHYINLKLFIKRHAQSQYRPVKVAHHSEGGASSVIEDSAFYGQIDQIIVRLGLFRLPNAILVKHCRRALKNHCTHLQRIVFRVLLFFLELF